MSTNAVIFYKSADGTFNGISVHFDGYVDGGVGEQLDRFWNDEEMIKKLCETKREIRCFGNDFDDIEFFDDYTNPLCRKNIKRLKGLTYDEMVNRSGNFNYSYFWDTNTKTKRREWFLIKNGYTFQPVKAILETAYPCH